jgi:hypothetical protein
MYPSIIKRGRPKGSVRRIPDIETDTGRNVILPVLAVLYSVIPVISRKIAIDMLYRKRLRDRENAGALDQWENEGGQCQSKHIE